MREAHISLTPVIIVCANFLQLCPVFATLWTVAHQAPLCMGFSRQEYWSGLPCPPSGKLPDPWSNLCPYISSLAGRFFTTSVAECKSKLKWSITSHWSESVQSSSVQSLSRVRLFSTPWIAARQASLSITNSWSSLRLTPIELVMPSSHLILCRPLLLLPPIPPSIRVFSNESTPRMRWPNDWSFSFSIIPSKEIPGLIAFRMDWLDLRAVQGTLKSLLQHHSSKASILRCSAFFTVNLSHPYMTT